MITQLIATNPASLPWMMCNTNYSFDFTNPAALVVDGSLLWVVNETGDDGNPDYGSSLTEMNAETGVLVKVVG